MLCHLLLRIVEPFFLIQKDLMHKILELWFGKTTMTINNGFVGISQ